MELPGSNKSSGGVLSSIKDRLGFSSNRESYDEYEDEEYFDDYDQDLEGQGDQDYGEYGYSDRNDYRGGTYNDPNHPPLVSLDDVRASTQVPDRLNRDPLASQQTAAVRPVSTDYEFGSQGRTSSLRHVERAADYMRSEPGSDAAAASRRSEGVDSLFSPTTPQNGAYDPYEAYSGAGRASHSPTRGISVMKPVAYGDVERVAKVLKAGDVVVLSMRNTPDQLAKRILDFSFGVSSALDASVECIADKVFVILRGSALSDQEKMSLRNQGVL